MAPPNARAHFRPHAPAGHRRAGAGRRVYHHRRAHHRADRPFEHRVHRNVVPLPVRQLPDDILERVNWLRRIRAVHDQRCTTVCKSTRRAMIRQLIRINSL